MNKQEMLDRITRAYDHIVQGAAGEDDLEDLDGVMEALAEEIAEEEDDGAEEGDDA